MQKQSLLRLFFVLRDLSTLGVVESFLAGLMVAEVIASPVGGAVCLW